jgi:hypothetical protein
VLLEEEHRRKGTIANAPSSVMTETDLAKISTNKVLKEIKDFYRRAYEVESR